jgi:hypothetical protein
MTLSHERIPLDQPATYLIQVQGLIAEGWLNCFDTLQSSVEGQDGWAVTTLTGPVLDQVALLGVLQNLYSLGLVLLRVERLANGTTGGYEAHDGGHQG